MSAAELEECPELLLPPAPADSALTLLCETAPPYHFSGAKKSVRSCCSLPQVPLLLPLYKASFQNLLGVIPKLPFFSSLIIFHVNHFCSVSDLLVLPAVGRNAHLAWWMLYSGADPQETIELCSVLGASSELAWGWAGRDTVVCLKWPHGLTLGNLSAAPSTVLAAPEVFLACKLCYLTHSVFWRNRTFLFLCIASLLLEGKRK